MALLNYLADSFRRNKIVAVILLISVAACAGVYYDRIDVDNLRLDGNTISSTNTNGDITLDPNGSGGVAFTDLTATTVPYLDSNKELTSSAVTPTELGYVSGVTSAIQTQLDAKLDDFTGSTDNVIVRTDGTGGDTVQESGVSIDDSDVVSGITQLNVDNIRIDGNTISSTDTNGTITLTPDGSGVVDFSSTINVLTQGELRLQDSSGGEYMGFKAPSTVTSSTSFTLPDGDGSNGQVLSTDGSATLSWATVGGGGWTYASKTANYTAAVGEFVNVDATSGNITITLPTASGQSGQRIGVRKSDSGSNTVTVDGNSAETINSYLTYVLSYLNDTIYIQSDGSNWMVVSSQMQPTVQRFTSGSGTYTTPNGVKKIKVMMAGGGGGGGGSGTASAGSGGAGGNTTFGSSFLTAGGGGGGSPSSGGNTGTGGSNTINSPAITIKNIPGGQGQGGGYDAGTAGVGLMGGMGGSNLLGAAGAGSSYGGAGTAGGTNSGAGGGGAATSTAIADMYAGCGGGSGSYMEVMIVNPSSSYSYSIGSGGAGGSAGTSGYSGGAGADGIIMVEEFY